MIPVVNVDGYLKMSANYDKYKKLSEIRKNLHEYDT